ncbi:MAG: hypothetical protein NTV51_19260 [Verrucomicrobia bacterium]|nr:hypothetical protein [Verrucomicrobiota bacterium]
MTLCRPSLLRRAGRPLAPWLGLLLATGLLFTRAIAGGAAAPPAKDEFSPLVELAPFVVNGQSLAVAIHARTRGDRRYGEQFAGGVIGVVGEAVTESTGKGLVIIGAKGEPHPIFVFRKFLALAKDGKLDPEVAARGPELSGMLDRWEHSFHEGQSDDGDRADRRDHDHGVDLDFEKILTALPLPLTGVGAKLYQLAWEEKFDEAKVEAKLRALRPGDLERRELFRAYDWVFYLPPKGAFDRVLDEIIADALKQAEVGFFARVAVKGALVVLKPKIRRAIEAMRQGMMFRTVVRARTPYGDDEVSALTDAYLGVFMPDEKSSGGSDHERAVKAVRDRLRLNAEKAAKTKAAEPPAPVPVEAARPEKTP